MNIYQFIPHLGTRLRLGLLDKSLKFTEEKKILDAGCGYGVVTEYLQSKGYEVVGIDMNDFRLEIAKVISGGAKIIKKDLFEINKMKEKFDGVVCMEVLEHIKQDAVIVRKLAKVIKKNGFLIVSFPGVGKTEKVYKKLGHVRMGYSYKMAEKMAKDGGFEIKKFWSYGNTEMGQKILDFNHKMGIWGILFVSILELLMKKDLISRAKGEVSGWVMRWEKI